MSTLTILLMSGAAYLVWAIVLAVQWQAAKQLSKDVYEKYHKDGTLKPTVTKDAFMRTFMRCEGPRFGTHLFAGAIAAPFMIMLSLMIFNTVWALLWRVSGQVAWFEVGELPHSLITVFLYVAVLFGVAWVTMWRYYAPGVMNFRAELRRLNGEDT